jgi:hypothetical protein
MLLSRSLFITLLAVFTMLSVKSQDSTSLHLDSTFTDTQVVDSTDITFLPLNSKMVKERESIKFVLYLISSELFEDAQYVLKQMQSNTISEQSLHDSVSYYIGWIQYFNQDFKNAISTFSTIDSTSEVLKASAFYNAICHVQLDSFESARRILEKIDVRGDDDLFHLKLLQLRGIALLQRDYQSFDSLSSMVLTPPFLTKTEMEEMTTYGLDMRRYKRKSPWIAGLLSALLPGLGKFYAGYRGIPFGAMYMTIPLGAIAAESLILAGAASFQFIALGALFGVFYVGNIWGSVLSVYAKEKEYYEELDHNIEFDMHTPIRRAFY